MKEKKYAPGQFCVAIECPRHKALEGLNGESYLKKKREHCKECCAWKFFIWMQAHNWKIIQTAPELTARELAAHIRGINKDLANDLTIDEILSL